jgi:hypothetical protein
MLRGGGCLREPIESLQNNAEEDFMTERKTKVQLVPGGPLVDGVEVTIEESSEKWSEYKLEDGTTIRLRQVLMEVSRTGQYDPEGNPVYAIKSQPVLSIIDVPDKLKRRTN